MQIEKIKPKVKVKVKVKPKPKLIKKPITKAIKKISKKIHKKKVIKKRKVIHKIKKIDKVIKPKKIIKEVKKTKKDPMAWLYEDKSEQEPKEIKKDSNTPNAIKQDIEKLYGAKFKTLSIAQQEYILDNQEIMRRITQKVLNRVARVNINSNINVNTNNIVEFYLYPNGDISDFKFLQKAGYFILDNTTKETIEYAYTQYPRPKEKTLIRYNVFYNLRY